MKREDIEKIYDFGKDATVNFIMQLVERIEKLENQIAKNSRNSSNHRHPMDLKNRKRRAAKENAPGKNLAASQDIRGRHWKW